MPPLTTGPGNAALLAKLDAATALPDDAAGVVPDAVPAVPPKPALSEAPELARALPLVAEDEATGPLPPELPPPPPVPPALPCKLELAAG